MATILKNSLELIEPLVLAALSSYTVTNYNAEEATLVVMVGVGGLSRPRKVDLKNWCATFDIPLHSMLGSYLAKLVALNSAMRMFSCTDTEFYNPKSLNPGNGWGDSKSCYFNNLRLRVFTALDKTGAEILTGSFTPTGREPSEDTNSRCIIWTFGGMVIASNFYSEEADDHAVYTALLIDSAYADDRVLLPLESLNIDDGSKGCIFLNANPTAYVQRELVKVNEGLDSGGPFLELAPKSKISTEEDMRAVSVKYGTSNFFWPSIGLNYGENHFGMDDYGEYVWDSDGIESVYRDNSGNFQVQRAEMEDEEYEEERHTCEECGYTFLGEEMVRVIIDGDTRFLCRDCANNVMNESGSAFSELSDGYEICRLIGCRYDQWVTPELPFDFHALTTPVFVKDTDTKSIVLVLKNGKRSAVLRVITAVANRNLTLVHRLLHGIYEPRYIFTSFIADWVDQEVIELYIQQPIEGIGEDVKTVVAFPRKAVTDAEQ